MIVLITCSNPPSKISLFIMKGLFWDDMRFQNENWSELSIHYFIKLFFSFVVNKRLLPMVVILTHTCSLTHKVQIVIIRWRCLFHATCVSTFHFCDDWFVTLTITHLIGVFWFKFVFGTFTVHKHRNQLELGVRSWNHLL